jgi:hypothetical protein
MTNPILGTLQEEIEQTRTVIDSAVVLINGISAKIQAAVDAALANGATESELQPFVALEQELEAKRTALAAAVAANP